MKRTSPISPNNVKKGLEILPVATVDEVLSRALAEDLKPIEWSTEDAEGAAVDAASAATEETDEHGSVTTH